MNVPFTPPFQPIFKRSAHYGRQLALGAANVRVVGGDRGQS